MEPSGHSVWFLDGPRSLPDLPKRPLRSNLEPSWLLFRPKTAPEAPRTPPKGLLGDVLGRLGGGLELLDGQEPTRASLGASWLDFGRVFG